MGDAARSIAETRGLNEQIDGGGNLLPDGADSHVGVSHADHHFQAAQAVARGVGMQRGERSIVTRVHGLQHVERFLGADLSHNDAVGAHTQRVDHQLADVDGARAFHVGRPGFHARHMRLLQAQLGGVFDGDDALVFRDVGGDGVEQGGFAGTRAAADQDVEARLDAAFQQFQHALGQGELGHQILAFERVAAETPDREQRAVHRDRRNHGVDARAIGQPGVHHGRRFVYAASHAGNDLFDDAQQVGVVLELHRCAVQFATPLHVDAVRRGHQNVADGGVLEQRFQRTEAEDLIEDFLDDPVLLH